MKRFTADFETNTSEDNCSVWAYGICEIGNVDNYIYGNNIEDFIKFCANDKENYILYFHNLKFDGEFIFDYLLRNGYTCVKDKKERQDKTFVCLINEMGQFYSIEIYFKVTTKKTNKVTIYDSLKILTFSVDKIAKDFDLPIRKLTLDYDTNREPNHKLTNNEIAYLKNDVEIMARALDIMFTRGLDKMTIGSNAINNYKEMISNFNHYFPSSPLEVDKQIRESYKGGFTYLNPKYREREVKSGSVLDVNSMYPAIMHNKKLPFGEPIPFDGKYESDRLYDLYIQVIVCDFKLKKGKIPCIQIKNSFSFIGNEWLDNSHDELVTLVLTNIDLELFMEQYDVYNISYEGGWKFKSTIGLFSKYIDFWTDEKIKAKKDKNGSMYLISKLMLNSLYGKFGTNPNIQSKYPFIDSEKDIIRYGKYPKETKDPVYCALSSFVTSYGRNQIIRTSQAIRDYSISNYGKDYYIYSDTDSIHSLFTDKEVLSKFVDIDDYRLGAWKLESIFNRGSYIRQKCYIENIVIDEDDYNKGILGENKNLYSKDKNNFYKLNVTIAGLPKKLASNINFKNFKKNFTCGGKLTFKHVKGGVILVDTPFTIK